MIPDTLFDLYDRSTLDVIATGLALLYLWHTAAAITWLLLIALPACIVWVVRD